MEKTIEIVISSFVESKEKRDQLISLLDKKIGRLEKKLAILSSARDDMIKLIESSDEIEKRIRDKANEPGEKDYVDIAGDFLLHEIEASETIKKVKSNIQSIN